MAGPRIVEVHVVVRHRAEAGNQELRAEQIVDGLRGRDHVAHRIGRGHVRGVRAFELLHAGAPALRAAGIDRAAALAGIVLRGQPLHRHLDEIRIAARGGAIGKGDLQHFGQMMDRLGGAEPHSRRCRSLRECSASARCARRRPPAAADRGFPSRDSLARIGARSTVLYDVRSSRVMKPPCAFM